MSATGETPISAPNERGATLLEMIVALGILAMMAGIVFPVFARPYSRLQAGMAPLQVQADMRLAHAQAVRTGQDVVLAPADSGRDYGWSGGRRLLPAGATLAVDQPLLFRRGGVLDATTVVVGTPGGARRVVIDGRTGAAEPGFAP